MVGKNTMKGINIKKCLKNLIHNHHTLYIESYAEDDELLSKINYKDIQSTLHDYRECAPLGDLCIAVNKHLKEFTDFK
jgi:hypothetical protein